MTARPALPRPSRVRRGWIATIRRSPNPHFRSGWRYLLAEPLADLHSARHIVATVALRD